jgi:hypothetical protein
VVAQVVGHGFAGVQPFRDLRVRDVAGHDERPGEGQPGLDRMGRQLRKDLGHRPVQIDVDHRAVVERDVGQEAGRVRLQLLQVDA